MDPLEKMICTVIDERVAAAIAAMPTKPSEQEIQVMKHRLLIAGPMATEIRAEAIARLEATQKPDLGKSDDSEGSCRGVREDT